eukprot:XP_016660241.1 PREDICTED: uncharacterized protein LOC107883859 isoform X1 [Acyrthosiphon pisum]
MTEAVVSGKDTCCLFINNGNDLLTLKKVVSEKTDKDDRNITIGSICTQEDRESETIYITNENSNEADVNNSEKDIQKKKMTEAVVSGKDTCCLFINNGNDLLTLKKVVSEKTDKDGEIQKLNKSIDTNGSESNTVCNITIGSICTQEDSESETINTTNENSNEADVNNSEKDIQVTSIKCQDDPYSPSGSPYDSDSHNLQNDYTELNNIGSPASNFNISRRAPIHSQNDLDTTFEDNHFLPKKEILNNERKRKFETMAAQDQKSTKILKLWNLMKYPFQKITSGTSIRENKSNISIPEIITEPELAVCKNTEETEKKNTQHNFEADDGIEDTSINVNTQPICNIM